MGPFRCAAPRPRGPAPPSAPTALLSGAPGETVNPEPQPTWKTYETKRENEEHETYRLDSWF